MKTKFLLITITLLLIENYCSSQSLKYYYDTGELKVETYYLYGVLEGIFTEYYKNGNIKQYGINHSDKKDGEYKEYNEIGEQKGIANYKSGIFEGEYKEYYENGQLKMVGNMAAGKQKGEWKYYDEKGELVSTEKFNFEKQAKRTAKSSRMV